MFHYAGQVFLGVSFLFFLVSMVGVLMHELNHVLHKLSSSFSISKKKKKGFLIILCEQLHFNIQMCVAGNRFICTFCVSIYIYIFNVSVISKLFDAGFYTYLLYMLYVDKLVWYCWLQLDVDIATHIHVKQDGPKRRFATYNWEWHFALLLFYFCFFVFEFKYSTFTSQ